MLKILAPRELPVKTVTVHKAKTTLSQLIAAVEDGEEVLILRNKEPVVRLVPAGEPVPTRQFGALSGKVVVTEAFFEALPENELAGWER